MGHAAVRRMLVVGLLAVVGLGAATEERAAGPGRWVDLKTPGGSVVADSGRQLWVAASDGLRYWDGRQFASPKVNEMEGKASPNSTKLYGDPGTGAYALVRGGEPNQGRAYRLAAGEVRFITDYYSESLSGEPGFCASRMGVLINWGRRFLATLRDGEWQRVEARLGEGPRIVKTPEHVVFVSSGWIYTVNGEGRITELAVPELGTNRVPFPGLVTAVPAQGEKILVTNQETNAAYLFNADSGQLVPAIRPNPDQDEATRQPRLLHTADGSLKPTDVPPSALVPGWESPLGWDARYRLAASDGSIWSVLSDGVVTHYEGGKLAVYDWKNGLRLNTACDILEGAGGQVFICSWPTIYLFLPGEPPPPMSRTMARWDEHHLVRNSEVVQDFDGRLWMRLWDRPGEFAIWDGQQWAQCKLSFDLTGIGPLLTDDRGHVMMAGGLYTERAYDVGLDGATAYESIRAMLPALVATGVRRFRPTSAWRPCYVLEGGRIWYGTDYYDGGLWTQFMQNGSDRIYESARYGVLFCRAEGSRYLYYDRGQFVSLPIPSDRATLWLLGEAGLQPFEEALVKEHPGAFLPVVRTSGGKFHLLREMPSFIEADPPLSALGDEVPQSGATVVAGIPPLHYLRGSGDGLRWVVQGRTFPVNLGGTPLEAKEPLIRRILVDASNNLWFVQHSSALMSRAGDLRVVTGPPPEHVGKALPLDVRVERDGFLHMGAYAFWRINDGPWQGGVRPGKVEIAFAESGEYRIELIGVDLQGGVTPQPVKLTVRATIGIPDTQVTTEGPYTVKDVVWPAPVKAVPSSPDAQATIEFRIDDGPWRTSQDGKVPTGGLKPGRHTAEFAANEKDGLRDRTPVRVEFDYQPDYAFIVDSRMDALTGTDPDAARRAMDEIRSAGPDAVPVLQRKIEEARKAAQKAADLKSAIEKLSEPAPAARPSGER